MTTRHMDFDAARAESETATEDPISFRLCGTDWDVRTDISGSLLMDFILSERVTDSLRSGKELLLHAIDPSRHAEFEQMLREGRAATPAVKANKASGIKAEKAEPAIPPPTMAQLDDVIAWLVRELIGRPTTPE